MIYIPEQHDDPNVYDVGDAYHPIFILSFYNVRDFPIPLRSDLFQQNYHLLRIIRRYT